MSVDGCGYVQIVDVFHVGGFEAVLREIPKFRSPPLFLPLMAFLMPFGVSAQTSAMVFVVTLGCLLPLLVFGISIEIFHCKKIALTAAWLMGINPTIISLATEPQRDIIYLFFTACFLFFFCRILNYRHDGDWFFAGLCFSFAILNRYEAVEILPLFLFVVFYAALRGILSWKTFFRGNFLFLGTSCFSIVLLLLLTGAGFSFFQTCYDYYTQKYKTIETYYQQPNTGS